MVNSPAFLPLTDIDSGLEITLLEQSDSMEEVGKDSIISASGLQPLYKCKLELSLLPDVGELRTEVVGSWIGSNDMDEPSCVIEVRRLIFYFTRTYYS